ncbi:hypothetical protein TCAL_15178, partial [Tigriopus californicus]
MEGKAAWPKKSPTSATSIDGGMNDGVQDDRADATPPVEAVQPKLKKRIKPIARSPSYPSLDDFILYAAVHCSGCRQVLRSRLQLSAHRDSGVCQCFFCRQSVNHDHLRVDQDFATLMEAKAWIVQEQLDRVFTIARSQDNRIVYQCRHRGMEALGKSTSTTHKQRKITSVPALNCQAVLRVDCMRVCLCEAQGTHGTDGTR